MSDCNSLKLDVQFCLPHCASVVLDTEQNLCPTFLQLFCNSEIRLLLRVDVVRQSTVSVKNSFL